MGGEGQRPAAAGCVPCPACKHQQRQHALTASRAEHSLAIALRLSPASSETRRLEGLALSAASTAAAAIVTALPAAVGRRKQGGR